jgi:uncharacterized protein (TIGR04255 family)
VTWNLPDCAHRTFGRNTLEVVICQLRFDPILKVHSAVPDFQDLVRKRFPRYEERRGEIVELNPSAGLSSRQVRDHFFWARPEASAAAVLGDQSLSLEYRSHRSRDELLSDASLVFGAMDQVFQEVSPLRLGLRYVNVVDRNAIGDDLKRTLRWDELLQDEFLKLPGSDDLEDARFATEITRPVAEGGHMTVRYGLLPMPGRTTPLFRLDIDRYREENLKLDECRTMLESFATDIYRLFMRAAGPSLVQWMEQNA